MYKIVVDSCGELPEELKKDGHFETVSLELEVDGYRIKDDETFNQLDFLRRVKKSITGPKSSCPSPEQYMQAYEGEAEHVYVVTLSGKLSGSYNSAELGRNLYEEEHPGENKQIYVFNSRSASIGETIIGLKVQEFEEAGFPFEEGMICQLGQARGMNKALEKMVQDMIGRTKDCEQRVLAIAHCNCPERAAAVKARIEKLANFKKIIIINTAGVSSMYANDGGVIMAV